MTDTLRIALLVEGSSDTGIRRASTWLEEIWNGHLVPAVGRQPFEVVAPISKKDLVAMDPSIVRSTGSEPLDMKLVRLGAGEKFDAAVVAWDLQPAWNDLGAFCRWAECVRLYELLSQSNVLPEPWRMQAAQRLSDYGQRAVPNARPTPPQLRPGTVMPLCMDPEFESLLTANEAATRRALGLASTPSDWPGGWGPGGTRRPAEDVLRVAIECVPGNSPIRRRIRGGWRQQKSAWGEYLLRQLLAEDVGRQSVVSHPISVRLSELGN